MAAVLTYEGMLGAFAGGGSLNPPLSGYAYYPHEAFCYPIASFSASYTHSYSSVWDDGEHSSNYSSVYTFLSEGSSLQWPADNLTYGLTQDGGSMLWLPGGKIRFTIDSESGSYVINDNGEEETGSAVSLGLAMLPAVVYNVGDAPPDGEAAISEPSIFWRGRYGFSGPTASEMTGFISGLQSPPSLTFNETTTDTSQEHTTITTTISLSFSISISGWTWWLRPG